MTLFSTGVTASAARGSIERSGASGPRLSGRNERRRRSGTTTSWYQTRPDPAGARSRPSPQRTRVPLPNHTLSARQLGGRSPTTRRRGVDLAAPAADGVTASRVEQAAGALAVLGEPVVAVGEVAAVDRQAAASHAVGEVVAELLEMTDARVQLGLPASRQLFPVVAGRRAAIRQLGEGGADVGQRDADALGDADQRHAPERVAPVAPLVARGAAAGDQLLPFVEMERRDGHPTARGELPDRQLRLVPGWLVHAAWLPARPQLWFRF